MKKIALLCVMVMAISLVPAFAADTNNTTTPQKQLKVKNLYKYKNEQKNTKKNCTEKLKVNARHQYKYKKGLKKSTKVGNSKSQVKAQHKHKYQKKSSTQKKNLKKNCTAKCKA